MGCKTMEETKWSDIISFRDVVRVTDVQLELKKVVVAGPRRERELSPRELSPRELSPREVSPRERELARRKRHGKWRADAATVPRQGGLHGPREERTHGLEGKLERK